MPSDVQKGSALPKSSNITLGLCPRLAHMNLSVPNFRGVAPGNTASARKGRALPHIRRHSRGREPLLPTAHRTLLTFFLLLLTAHCALPTVSASGWQRQRTSSMAWLHSVFFLDQNRGWVAGSRGTLLATTDGGAHWRSLVHPSEDTIRDIYFADELIGIIVCERNIYDLKANTEARAYLMKTADGGEHWQRVVMRATNTDARIMRAIFTGA